MKKSIAIIFITMMCLQVTAQRASKYIMYQHAISFHPLNLIGVDNTAMMTYENRLNEKMSILSDAGWVFQTYQFSSESVRDVSGFILRPAVKIFVSGNRNNMYVQPQLMFKSVRYHMEDWLGKEMVGETPTYEQYQQFIYLKTMYGGHFLIGWMLPVGESFYVDLFIGAGARYREYKVVGEPTSQYKSPGAFNGGRYDMNNVAVPTIPGGVKLTVTF